jgi:GTPase SAR1 family protein
MTTVVVGNTGAGKSTLINGLLGESNVLPTNGMRACTVGDSTFWLLPNSSCWFVCCSRACLWKCITLGAAGALAALLQLTLVSRHIENLLSDCF